MRKYNSYKDSGVEWIGEIPIHWELKKISHFGDVTLGKMLTPEDKGGFVLKPYLRSQNIQNERVDISDVKEMWFSKSELEKLKLWKGDLLLNEGGDVGRTCMWDNELDECYIQNSVNRVRFQEDSQKYFLYLSVLYHSVGYYDSVVNRVSIPHLTKEKLESIRFLRPPLSEQHQIVSYLDRKTAQIDSLIEKTQRKIELLKENRTSLINEAVTKGLNPHVEMTESGVEWIGEIPSGWILKPLKHIIKNLNSGTSVNSEDTPVNGIDEFGVLKTSCVFGDTFRPEENKKVVIDEYDRVKCPITKDSIIFSRMNTPDLVGSNGYVEKDFGNLFLPDRLWITEFFEDIQLSVKWLSFVTISRRFRSELSSRSTGTSPSMKNITKDDLLTIKIPYPSFSEQLQIVSYLDKQTELIDKTVSVEERRIELLKAYRQSLISEVVTGKRKVITDE